MAICLDSDFIIDLLKGKSIAIDFFNKHRESEELFTTEVSKFEIFSGIYLKKVINEQEKLVASGFFDSLSVLPFGDGCGEIASHIFASLVKSGEVIGQADIFISAIMKKNGCSHIITRNKDHYSRIDGIKVINY